jgi:hypothetical protein
VNKHQFKFTQDVIALLLFVWEKGWRVTFGEAYRPQKMQEIYYEQGKTQTLDSYHLKRLAIDFNFFKPDGDKFTLTYDKDEIQIFGDYWESLDELNTWGGNWEFTDTPHFERTV